MTTQADIIPQIAYYVTVRNGSRTGGLLGPYGTHAEAFHMSDVEEMRQRILRTFPGCECFPIECSSNKIIPANMRQLMNCA